MLTLLAGTNWVRTLCGLYNGVSRVSLCVGIGVGLLTRELGGVADGEGEGTDTCGRSSEPKDNLCKPSTLHTQHPIT